jgi:hypothetical protein
MAYEAARDELAKLAPARPAAELEALIRGAQRNPRTAGCTALNGSLRVTCAKLEAEFARARQLDTLKADMDRASADLTKTGTPKIANSDAVALASYLAGLGIDTSADRINKLLVLLAVLVIECGGGLALAVGMALSAAPADQHLPRGTLGTLELQPTTVAGHGTRRLPTADNRPDTVAGHPVVTVLQAAGRALSNNQLAAAMRVTKGEASRRWREVAHVLRVERRVRELAISLSGRLH